MDEYWEYWDIVPQGLDEDFEAVDSGDEDDDADEVEVEETTEAEDESGGGNKGRKGKGRGRGRDRNKNRRRRPPAPTHEEVVEKHPIGSEIIIQITKGQIGTKGPRTTTNLAIPGRFMVLMPFSDQSGISRKIEDREERKRLKQILAKLKIPEGMSVILRTAGEGKDLEYIISVTELPKVSIKGLSSIKVDEYIVKIDNKETDKRISEIAKSQNNFKEAEANYISKMNDLVVFDYKATVDGKDFKGNEGKNTQLVIGKDLFIKGFDKQLEGVKSGDTKKVEVNLPENFPEKDLVGKKAVFNCKITSVKKSKEVNIDDEFAKTLGAKDLKDLKELLTKQINEEYKNSLWLINVATGPSPKHDEPRPRVRGTQTKSATSVKATVKSKTTKSSSKGSKSRSPSVPSFKGKF